MKTKKKTVKKKLTWVCEGCGKLIEQYSDGLVQAHSRWPNEGMASPLLHDPIVVHRTCLCSPSKRGHWSVPLTEFTGRDKWQNLKELVELDLLTPEGATKLADKLRIRLYYPIRKGE